MSARRLGLQLGIVFVICALSFLGLFLYSAHEIAAVQRWGAVGRLTDLERQLIPESVKAVKMLVHGKCPGRVVQCIELKDEAKLTDFIHQRDTTCNQVWFNVKQVMAFHLVANRSRMMSITPE